MKKSNFEKKNKKKRRNDYILRLDIFKKLNDHYQCFIKIRY